MYGGVALHTQSAEGASGITKHEFLSGADRHITRYACNHPGTVATFHDIETPF